MAATAICAELVAGTACTGDRKPADFDPAAAATSLRALGSLAIAGTAELGPTRINVGARIQSSPSRITARLAYPAGRELVAVGYRRRGSDAWIQRAVVTTPGVITFGLPLLIFRGPARVPYVELTPANTTTADMLVVPFDPARLLDQLAQSKRVVRLVGTRGSGNSRRLHFSIQPSSSDARRLGIIEVSVWTTTDHIPVEVRVSTANAMRARYTITPNRTAVRVSAPPAAQIDSPSRPLPDATGPYVEVLTHVSSIGSVRVLRAPGTAGWTCWKLDATPAAPLAGDVRPSGGVCVPPLGAAPDDGFAIPIDTDANADVDGLGMLVPPGSRATGLRIDASPVELNVDDDGILLSIQPTANPLALITITTPANDVLVCGPGSITTAADVNEGGVDAATVRAAPWNCITGDIADLIAG